MHLTRRRLQALPPTPPESWNGCLDEHRLDAAGTHAAWPASDTVLDPPSQRPFAQAFYPAPYGAAYECMTYPAPTQFRFQLCYGDVSDWPAEFQTSEDSTGPVRL